MDAIMASSFSVDDRHEAFLRGAGRAQSKIG
jgi:hypothetical protein